MLLHPYTQGEVELQKCKLICWMMMLRRNCGRGMHSRDVEDIGYSGTVARGDIKVCRSPGEHVSFPFQDLVQ
jgi:hypothetical protein